MSAAHVEKGDLFTSRAVYKRGHMDVDPDAISEWMPRLTSFPGVHPAFFRDRLLAQLACREGDGDEPSAYGPVLELVERDNKSILVTSKDRKRYDQPGPQRTIPGRLTSPPNLFNMDI